MASHRLCLRFTFFALVFVATLSVILVISHGSLDEPYRVVASWRVRFRSDGNSSKEICDMTAMQDILLVISYVEITRDEVSALNELYRDRFPHILFCGTTRSHTGSDIDFLIFDIQRGITAYGCLAGAIHKYPDYKGYLFTKSTLYVNYWEVAKLSPHRIWHTATLGNQAVFQQSRNPWIWWYTPWGLKACEKAYKKMIFLNSEDKWKIIVDETSEKESPWDIENSLNALLWNGRGRYKCYRGNADIFYIPARYAYAFEKMAQIFEEFSVFMDIAVSTIIHMLELKEKNVELEGVNLGRRYVEERAAMDSGLFIRQLNSTVAYVRPILATSSGDGGNLVREIRNRIDGQISCVQEGR